MVCLPIQDIKTIISHSLSMSYKIYNMTSVMNFKIFKVKEKIQMHHPRLLELTTISGVPYKVMNHYSALTIKPIFFYCYFIVILQFKNSSENCCYGVLLFIPQEMERKKTLLRSEHLGNYLFNHE